MHKLLLTFFSFLLVVLSTSAQQRFISVGGDSIWINTMGLDNREQGKPVIVFESGFGTPMEHWDKILGGSAELAPLVTYDRSGIGKSPADDDIPTVKYVADKLVKILEALEVGPPYVLVGHSLGGAYVRGFANYYPEVLAGLVIIDPADFTETQQNKRDYYKVLHWDEARIDQELASLEQKRLEQNENFPKSLQEEREVLYQLRQSDFKELLDTPLPNIPVHIITGGRFDMPAKYRSKEYDSELYFRSKMEHRVARWTAVIQSVDKGMLLYSGDAGHFVHVDDPELVISSIDLVLKDYEKMMEKKD